MNLPRARTDDAAYTLTAAIAPFNGELGDLESLLRDASNVGFDLLSKFLESSFGAGGARLRPALVFAIARLAPDLGVVARRQRENYPPDAILNLAAAVETLYHATRVHDDLVDGAAIRHGRSTLHSRWGVGATILAGDWFFARASGYGSSTGSVRVVQNIALTLKTLTDNELRQLLGGQGLPSLEDYEGRVYGKTASLFETAAEGAGELIGATPEQQLSLKRFGCALGRAFQIINDLQDFIGDEQVLGKPVGSDLRSGQVTLPALLYLRDHPPVESWSGSKVDPAVADALIAAVRGDEEVLAETRAAAQSHLRQALVALSALPAGAARTQLETIARAALKFPAR